MLNIPLILLVSVYGGFYLYQILYRSLTSNFSQLNAKTSTTFILIKMLAKQMISRIIICHRPYMAYEIVLHPQSRNRCHSKAFESQPFH